MAFGIGCTVTAVYLKPSQRHQVPLYTVNVAMQLPRMPYWLVLQHPIAVGFINFVKMASYGASLGGAEERRVLPEAVSPAEHEQP